MKMNSMTQDLRKATIKAYLPKAEALVRERWDTAHDPAMAAQAALTSTKNWDKLGNGPEEDETVLLKILDMAAYVYPEYFAPREA